MDSLTRVQERLLGLCFPRRSYLKPVDIFITRPTDPQPAQETRVLPQLIERDNMSNLAQAAYHTYELFEDRIISISDSSNVPLDDFVPSGAQQNSLNRAN
jgi:hypothetical protein